MTISSPPKPDVTMAAPLSSGESASAAETLLAALTRRDFDAAEATLDPAVRFRALTPSRLIEAAGAAETIAYPRQWFGDADAFETLAAEVGDVAGRPRLSYRFRLHDEDGWQVIEQQVYVTAHAGKIVELDLLCSGFRPEGTAAEGGAAPSAQAASTLPHADAVLHAVGEGCATLTPLIRTRIRELESGQILEVRTDDPAAREGVPAWSRLTGHQLVAADDGGDTLRFFLEKK